MGSIPFLTCSVLPKILKTVFTALLPGTQHKGDNVEKNWQVVVSLTTTLYGLSLSLCGKDVSNGKVQKKCLMLHSYHVCKVVYKYILGGGIKLTAIFTNQELLQCSTN